jgi:hypothetical protein
MAPRHSRRSKGHESVEGSPTLFTTVIVTRTTVRWVKPSSTLKRVASRSQHPAHIDVPLASQDAGECDTSLEQPVKTTQPSNHAASSPTLSPTSSPKFPEDITLARNFLEPDISIYPLTLYDPLAEAPTNTAILHCNSTPYNPCGSMEGSEFELPDIPPSVQTVLFVCLGAGAVWSILVWLINLPLEHPNHNAQKRSARGAESAGKSTWWKRAWKQWHVAKQGTANKSSLTYAALLSSSSTGTASSSAGISMAATMSATPERGAKSPVRLRKLTPSVRRQTSPSPALLPWGPPTPAGNTAFDTHAQSHHRDNDTPLSSLAYQFLARPLNLRTSSEYLAAHHAFFSKPLPTPPPPSTALFPQSSPHISSHLSRSASPVSDLDALEAQSDTVVLARRSRSTRSVLHIADGVERTGEKLWTGGWTGVLEEGVTKVVDAMMRWTEDEEGEKGLLVPIGRRGAGE